VTTTRLKTTPACDDQTDRRRESLYTGFVSDIAIFVLKRDVKLQLTNYTQGDSDAISSYHINTSGFPTKMWGKLWEMFLIVTSLS